MERCCVVFVSLARTLAPATAFAGWNLYSAFLLSQTKSSKKDKLTTRAERIFNLKNIDCVYICRNFSVWLLVQRGYKRLHA